MRLVEFLMLLLQAHGETLLRLAALLGEDNLLEILESVGNTDEGGALPEGLQAFKEAMQRHRTETPSPYLELQDCVRELKLPSMLEFYVWSYYPYRHYIESGLNLDAQVPQPFSDEAAITLVEESIHQARVWLKNLPIPTPLLLRADLAAKTPWLKFRAEVLKQMGKRPLRAVSDRRRMP